LGSKISRLSGSFIWKKGFNTWGNHPSEGKQPRSEGNELFWKKVYLIEESFIPERGKGFRIEEGRGNIRTARDGEKWTPFGGITWRGMW